MPRSSESVAALTYARGYALFTLVGIAGEDDLDAPDLCAPAPTSSSRGAVEAGGPKAAPRGQPVGIGNWIAICAA
jgi:hypothetical protein